MILDVSKWQGAIDWEKVFKTENIERVIIRAGQENGALDPMFSANLDGVIKNAPQGVKPFPIDIYKFSYVRDYGDAYLECADLVEKVRTVTFPEAFNYLWLDLEKWGGRDYKKTEANNVIKGYLDATKANGMKLGLYCNYNYIKNIIDSRWAAGLPLWLARYGSTMGNVAPWRPIMWQYTSKGKVQGINGNVDVSRYV